MHDLPTIKRLNHEAAAKASKQKPVKAAKPGPKKVVAQGREYATV